MPETPNTTPPEPACPLCGAPVADADYHAHITLCRAERAKEAREKVLARIKELYPKQYEQAVRELAEEKKHGKA